MWGNLRGWGISAVIVLVSAAGMWLLSTLNDISPPVWDAATQQKYLAKMQLTPDPRSVVPVMTKPCDAGDNYRAAIAAYQADQRAYDTAKTDSTAELEAFDDILKGAECANMTLLAKDPAEYMGYGNKIRVPIDALTGVVKAMNVRAFGLMKRKQFGDAKKYYEAMFSLGAKLWDERLLWDELDAGAGFMGYGTHGLEQLAENDKDTARYNALSAFDQAKGQLWKNIITPLEQTTHNVTTEAPGNVFLVARSSSERMWRAEAIRQMGRIRWNVGSSETAGAADQRAAGRMLAKWAADPTLDPVLKATAEKARDVTPQDIQAEVAGN